MISHQEFLKSEFGSRFEVLEHMVDEFRGDDQYTDNPAAMRAISVALEYMQTAQMWVNKAIYAEEEEHD